MHDNDSREQQRARVREHLIRARVALQCAQDEWCTCASETEGEEQDLLENMVSMAYDLVTHLDAERILQETRKEKRE